jgi:nicotinate-nucleotide pyrophosphorylase (carboxylating)
VPKSRIEFTDADRKAAESLIDLALAEDLAGIGDLTCNSMIGESDRADVLVVAREAGIVAGLPIGELVFAKVDPHVGWVPEVADGTFVKPGQIVARAGGPLTGILTGERTALNFVGHLSGIASLTHEFVEAARGTAATILDTRKTLPGWRSLAKYAVRAGGGTNHRMGLFDGVLVKDNHIASWSRQVGNSRLADAVRQARAESPSGVSVEFEVDTLEQFRDVLAGRPDIVLLDNMSTDELREAVRIRNENAPNVLLEASGGITLDTVRAIAETGVERISIGALTHSARCFDLGFDFHHID